MAAMGESIPERFEAVPAGAEFDAETGTFRTEDFHPGRFAEILTGFTDSHFDWRAERAAEGDHRLGGGVGR